MNRGEPFFVWLNRSRKSQGEDVSRVEDKSADSNAIVSKAEGNKKREDDFALNGGEEEEHRSRQTGDPGIRKGD